MSLPFPHTARCFSDHLGVYAALPRWLSACVTAIKSGTMPLARAPINSSDDYDDDEPRRAYTPADMYARQDGIAVIDISGPMMKGGSKYAKLSTTEIRRALRDAVSRDDVSGILLRVDSPGGSVAGTNDLAMEVAEADTIKPVHAFVEDLCASAALWVASQARHVSATTTSEIGSIGAYSVVYDESKAAELAGLKVHVVSTGPQKGAFVPGTEITPEQLASLRVVIEDLNAHFLAAVGEGRELTPKAVRELATGETWIGKAAKERGLIDSISTGDDAFARLVKAAPVKSEKAKADRLRRARASLASERFRL